MERLSIPAASTPAALFHGAARQCTRLKLTYSIIQYIRGCASLNESCRIQSARQYDQGWLNKLNNIPTAFS